MTKMTKTEIAVRWMENLASDDTHGYDQERRWGENNDYDCSSAVITAWEKAGVPVKSRGASYTGNMYEVFRACGFEDVTAKVDLSSGKGLERGDVLLNTARHTAVYCGNSKEAEASINEKGAAAGGRPGDQTGREILVREYRNYPWDYVLRYREPDGKKEPGLTDTGEGAYRFVTVTVRYASKGASVRLLQILLRGLGYIGRDGQPLQPDSEAGQNTIHALKMYQKNRGLEADGICGPLTWRSLAGL